MMYRLALFVFAALIPGAWLVLLAAYSYRRLLYTVWQPAPASSFCDPPSVASQDLRCR